jgi:AcrR family transcriptional regulator
MDSHSQRHRAVNPPKQTRSQRTLERIVRASLDILDEDGPAGLTVHSIVERAGSSVGSFYARFRGKDDLLEYLGERVWREALDRWHEALDSRDWSELDLPQIAEGSVGLLVDSQRSRSSYLKSLDRATGGNDDAYVRFRRTLIEGIAQLLLSKKSDIDHLQPELAVHLGLLAVLGVVDAEHDPGGSPLPRSTVVREASDLLISYLTPGARGGSDGDVDFFDIWG